MERTHRCELLARLSDRDLIALASLVVDETRDEIIPLTPPTVGMIMARAEDGARGDVFNLGEVLVTECLVQIGDREGWSTLLGARPQGALAAAAIDAVASGDHPDVGNGVASAVATLDAQLTQLIADQDAIAAAERARLATTRVQFDTQ